jgi:hypothetical protein
MSTSKRAELTALEKAVKSSPPRDLLDKSRVTDTDNCVLVRQTLLSSCRTSVVEKKEKPQKKVIFDLSGKLQFSNGALNGYRAVAMA